MRPSNGEIVRTLWQAHRESRVDDMLDLLHPDITWRPLNPPGVYQGREAVRQMVEDLRSANGLYWLELDEVDDSEPDEVRVVARVVSPSEQGPPNEVPIAFLTTMRDGLILAVQTVPLPSPPSFQKPHRLDDTSADR